MTNLTNGSNDPRTPFSANRSGVGNISRPGSDPASSRMNIQSQRDSAIYDLQRRVLTLLSPELRKGKIEINQVNSEKVREFAHPILTELIKIEGEKIVPPLTKPEARALVMRCLEDISGFGIIDSLMKDDTISEIIINGPFEVWVEQHGVLKKSSIRFQNELQLMTFIERLVAHSGRRIDESSPMVDSHLSDGSRLNAVIRPIAPDGPMVTIRKFKRFVMSPEKLIEIGSVTLEALMFIHACVESRANVIVMGGTNSGKTTLLNILSCYIPDSESIITIEDSLELQLNQDNVRRMVTRPPSVEGKNEVTMRDLVRNSLRMRPDRIIVGECRGGETLDMLQSMNTGHEGSMTTIHANGPQDLVSRLETLVMFAGYEIPMRAIHEQIANAIHVVVHTDHFRDGSRRIRTISEVRKGGSDGVEIVDIFRFEPTGTTREGKILGHLMSTNLVPRVLERIEQHNLQLPPRMFQR